MKGEHRSKRSRIQHRGFDSSQNVDDNDSAELHHKLPQSHSPSIDSSSQQAFPIYPQLAHVTSWEQEVAWQSHSPALPIADTASSAGVQLSLSSDPNPTSFAALEIHPKPSLTPLKSRLSSYDADHQSHVRSRVNCRQMGGLIMKEIPSEMIVEDDRLYQKIFPPPSFTPDPTQFSQILTRMDKVWSKSGKNWRCLVDMSSEKAVATMSSEKAVATFLNSIGAEFGRVMKMAPSSRKWVADTCNTPVKGANPATQLQCKPDIVLIDKEFSAQPTWNRLLAFGEITSRPTYHSVMKQTVFTKTHLTFSAQESRRFVCSLAFYGQQARLSLIDREGVLYQEVKYLNSGPQNAAIFVHMVVGFMYGNLTGLGYDPTIQLKPNGAVDTIEVTQSENTTTYRVTKPLHVATGVIGRGTRVWQAHALDDPTKQVVIKDAWPLVSRADLEERALRLLAGVPGIPVVAQIATVSFTRYEGGRCHEDSTDAFRGAVVSSGVHHRRHRRLVMSSVGARMSDFRSLSELIGAFRDIIIGK
jgi:Fungal protein kinase